jgi:hypothetical protein
MGLTTFDPGTILLDASTVEFLSGHVLYHSLTDPYWADERVAEALRAILSRQVEQCKVDSSEESDLYALTHALSFLEQWMLAEKLLVDRSALNSLAKHNRSETRTEHLGKLGALYTEIDISQAISKEAARHVVAFVDLMRDINNPLRMPDFDNLPLKDSYYNPIDGNLGESGNDPARALFYLELSRLLNAPLLLHPEKSIYLRKISHAITDGVASVYRSLTDEVRDALKLNEVTIPIPPIADEILRTACQERCSLLEAAAAIRDSKEMVSLRNIIWELTTLVNVGQRIRYEHEIELRTKEIADSIQSRAVAGTRISRRKVNLAEVPAIGIVFKVLGGGTITIPDLVLYERPHIALFSRWANEAQPIPSSPV